MTPPVLVTGPTVPVVSTADLKAHLRVDHADEDALIASLHDAAVAHLDGWRGVLGRAIRAQTWRVSVYGPGPHLLPMPDVTAVTATANADPVEVEQALTVRGVEVTLPAGTEGATITFTCEMPSQLRPAVEAAVKLLVGHWYAHREAVGLSSAQELPMAVPALVGALRWRLV
jgi:hypothetical protein